MNVGGRGSRVSDGATQLVVAEAALDFADIERSGKDVDVDVIFIYDLTQLII